MDYAGVWLPCGLQNFFRVNGELPAKLPFAEETALFDHLKAKFTVISGPTLDDERNMCSAWFEVDDQRLLYVDSDGFIVTVGGEELIPLAPKEYRVRRSTKQSIPDLGNYQSESEGWLLSNFQLNLLLEGIWNSAFDPAVFLMSNEQRAESVMGGFNIGSLLSELTTASEISEVDTACPIPAKVRRLIFRKAVRILRNDHLLPLKWNVEATRRHLFSETMTMLHRPERLMQFVSPHGADREALFNKSSDEQLRGYVMLISAKLPLIDNLTFLAQDCLHALILDSGDDAGARGEVQILEDLVTSWKGTAEALHGNVNALERSFTSIWQDQLLHETEQVRIEEEALGELQRQQALDKTTRWFDTLIFVITLGVAFAALYFSAGGAQTLKNHTATVWEIAAGIVVVASIVFWIGPRGFGHMLGDHLPRYEQVTRLDEVLRIDTMTVQGQEVDWMDLPLLDTELYDLRRPECAGRLRQIGKRIFFTNRMRCWINLHWPCSPAADDDSTSYFRIGLYIGEQIPRIRVDTPSAIDTYARIHLDLNFLLSRRRRITIETIFRQKYAPILRGLTDWGNRLFAAYSETLPRRRVTAQCVLELHKHSPDPGEIPLYFVRELRLVMSSRVELTPYETLMLVQIVDAVLLDPLVRSNPEHGERSNGRSSLLADRLSPSQGKVGIKPSPPPLNFSTWEDFADTPVSDRRSRYAEEAEAASRNGLLSRRSRKHVDEQSVAAVLENAQGHCYYCGSLALESRPLNWMESPSTWAPIGRRIGSVGYSAMRSAEGKINEGTLVWCCLWCNIWPRQRNIKAVDHGGYYPELS